MKPWEIINKLSSASSVFTKEDLLGYNQFIINRGLSGNKGLVLIANELNKQLSDEMHSDFLAGFLSGKVYPKWYKPGKAPEDIAFIAEYYKVNKQKAEEYLDLLTPKQLKELKSQFGGQEKPKSNRKKK